MRHLVLPGMLLISSLAFAADKPASCEIAEKNVLSRSSSGIAQVSNVGLIEITCRVPARPWPQKPIPGSFSIPLKVKTTAYQIAADDTKTLVPSQVNQTGGGGDRGPPELGFANTEERVLFYLNIPVDPAEAIAQMRDFNKMLEAETTLSEGDRQHLEERLRYLEQHPEELAEFVRQYRVGRFQVECRLMDGDRVWGVGHVELEVLFKGRAFDGVLFKNGSGRPPKG